MSAIEDYAKTKMYALQPDSGIHVSGFPTADGIGSMFLGLGNEPVAREFRDKLARAMNEIS